MDKSPDAFRTISEVADWLGTPTHVLRFWESRFTQVKPVKRAGGRRYYRPSDMMLLGGIRKLLHDDGLTIRGVQKILREKGVKHVAAMSPPVDGEEEAEVEAGFMQDAPAAPQTAEVVELRPSKPATPGRDATPYRAPEAGGATQADPAEPAPDLPDASVEPPAPGFGGPQTPAPEEPRPLWGAPEQPVDPERFAVPDVAAPAAKAPPQEYAADEDEDAGDADAADYDALGWDRPPVPEDGADLPPVSDAPPADPVGEEAADRADEVPRFGETVQTAPSAEPPQESGSRPLPPMAPMPEAPGLGEEVLIALRDGARVAPARLRPVVGRLEALRDRMRPGQRG